MSREKSSTERYMRLRREANELFQKQMRETMQQINESIRGDIQKHLDAMEDAIKRGDYIEAWRHQMILEVLFGVLR